MTKAWALTYTYLAGASTGTTSIFSLPNHGTLRHVTLGPTGTSIGPLRVNVACTVAFAGHGLINNAWVRADSDLGSPAAWDGYLDLELAGAGANTITCFTIERTGTATPMALTVEGDE